jgi:hypothetical protein
MIDWKRAKAIRCWTPIEEAVSTVIAVEDKLFQIGPTQYVICTPYREDLVSVPGGHFVTVLYWATSEGAARRAVLHQIERDDRQAGMPPAELIPSPDATSYGEILDKLRLGAVPFRESASYRIATDGAFIDRRISTQTQSFHFRGRDDDDGETCYAIEYRLQES